MWMVVYMARHRENVGQMRDLLSEGGVITKMRPVGGESSTDGYYEILVPGSEVSRAHEVIIEGKTA